MRARKADSDAETLTLGDHNAPDAQPTAAMHHVRPLALPPMFCEGDVLSERFRILRFLAHGGMGEVYAAQDLELGTTVALKTIRRGVDGGEPALERFRREALLARRVTHPNVCRIFDVFRHRFPAQDGQDKGDLLFLSMELLEGETLSERLRRTGRFETAQALPVVEQMAEALDAAHRAGVVHRDFKSNNVMLVPQDDGGLRTVVTDFGLAGRHHETDQPQDEAGLTMGTPAYMAPEQVEGAEVTSAADIYGLGIVMYEMVTATVPFMALNPVATANLRLHSDPPSPRRHVPDLDPRWEQAILRCLARRPEKRFASAGDAARALRPALPFTSARRSPRRLVLELVLALALLGSLAWAFRLGMRPRAVGPLKSIQVTTSAGLDLFPALSPDGKRLIYASDRGGDFELYLRSTEPGGSDVPITADGQQNFQPAWSPDGQLVAYHSQKRGGIWVVPVTGGTSRRLTDFGSRPAWSRDGTRLVFQSEALVDLAANAVPAMPPSTLWVVAATGGKPQQITTTGTPAGGHGGPQWSPDGARLVFTASDRRASSVWSVRVDGRNLKMMSSVQVYGYDPIYAADGTRIYFSGLSQSGNYGLWSLDIDATDGAPRGEPVQIADLGMGSSRHLNMARDGSRIAFSALRMSSNLWRLPLGANGEPRALTAETGRSARPIFAPDGLRLAFDRWQSGTNPDVWTIDADGRNARQLTRDSAVDTVPNWTPDGRAVVFVSARENKAGVWSHDLANGQESFLTLLGIDTDWARLSPDGKTLAYSRRGADGIVNVWRVNLAADQPRQITFDAEFAGFPCWSPDGRWLAVQLRRGQDSQIAIMPAEGGALDPLTHGPGQHWPYSFWPDGQSVAFAGQPGDLWNIYRIDRHTRREELLTHNRKLNAYLRYPAVSPLGDTLVYEYAETSGNIWLLEGLK